MLGATGRGHPGVGLRAINYLGGWPFRGRPPLFFNPGPARRAWENLFLYKAAKHSGGGLGGNVWEGN